MRPPAARQEPSLPLSAATRLAVTTARRELPPWTEEEWHELSGIPDSGISPSARFDLLGEQVIGNWCFLIFRVTDLSEDERTECQYYIRTALWQCSGRQVERRIATPDALNARRDDRAVDN